jgi:hypothetical protein
MKKLFTTLMAVALLMAIIGPGTAFAGAYETDFTTSITYQNISDDPATIQISFYDSPSDLTPTVIDRPELAAGAGTSIYVGGLTQLGSGFEGTAVMSSSQPLAATMVQVPASGSGIKVRPLSNGFTSGTEDSLIATVLKNMFRSHTKFSVQNVGSASTTATISFIDTSATTVHQFSQVLQPGAGVHVDAATITQLGTSFNGSVYVETTGGSIVTSAMELAFDPWVAGKAFEGVGQGSMNIYMPSALCNYGTYSQTAYYAVQNTSLTTPTTVRVTYSNGLFTEQSVGLGAKASFSTCDHASMPSGFIGSATITSTATNIVAIGKVSDGTSTSAFNGFSEGFRYSSLPYVRWATNTNYFSGYMQRTYIAIQNVGGATITGNIVVKYIDRDGVVVGTHTITTDVPVGEKVNSNPSNAGLSEFGCYNSCTQYGGSTIVEGPAGSELAVVARVVAYDPVASLPAFEDYNGIEIPVP